MPKRHYHLRHTRTVPFGAAIFLSVLEGVEGGFAIFAGIIVGLSFTDLHRDFLIMSATISIVVNALNASAVRYATEHYTDELDGRESRSWFKAYFVPSLVEFVVYCIVSAISIVPLILIEHTIYAVVLCVAITLVTLFAAGLYRGALLGRHALRDGLEVMGLGALIILAGGVSGWLLNIALVPKI